MAKYRHPVAISCHPNLRRTMSGNDNLASLAIQMFFGGLATGRPEKKWYGRWTLPYIIPPRPDGASTLPACTCPPTKGFEMLDYEQCLTCEDTCDDWFQEAPNQERETGS